jgi:hypothetical protein
MEHSFFFQYEHIKKKKALEQMTINCLFFIVQGRAGGKQMAAA